MAERAFRLFVVLPAAAAFSLANCAHTDSNQKGATTTAPAQSPTLPSVGPVRAGTTPPVLASVAPKSASAPSNPATTAERFPVLKAPRHAPVGELPVALPSSSRIVIASPSLSPAMVPTVAAVAPEIPAAVSSPQLEAVVVATRREPTTAPAAQGAAAPIAPPVGTPQILHATVSPDVVASGTKVDAAVRTTPEVVTVVAKVAGKTIPVPRVGTGRFEGTTTVPFIPPFFHGKYNVTFVASNSLGVTTQAAVKVTIP